MRRSGQQEGLVGESELRGKHGGIHIITAAVLDGDRTFCQMAAD